MARYNIPTGSLSLNVSQFVFTGPDTLIDDDYNCQYGGLIIYFVTAIDRQFEYCNNVNNFPIYSDTNEINIVLVWFSGYSSGSFNGNIYEGDCKMYYLEVFPKGVVYIPDLTVTSGSAIGCHSFICAPLVEGIQNKCSLRIDHSSTISLQVKYQQTLGTCDPAVKEQSSEKAFVYSLNVSFSNNWPFGTPVNTYTRHNLSGHANHNFDYLHNGKLSLNLMCNKSEPRKQVSVVITKSECLKRHHQLYTNIVVQSIPALTERCLQYVYTFTSDTMQISRDGNYHDFIYKDSGHINTGHDVSVKYETCPSECRKYKFSLFVKNAGKSSITEYISDIGHTIFTGFYHRGFRISIVQPEKICIRNSECKLQLLIDNHYPILGLIHQMAQLYIPKIIDSTEKGKYDIAW